MTISFIRTLLIGIAAMESVALLLPEVARADHTSEPNSVALVGNLQSELGCPADWQPECGSTELVFDGTVWTATFFVAGGSWEYKVALDDGWNENYGANGAAGGANIVLQIPPTGLDVTFVYDHDSHIISTDIATPVTLAEARAHWLSEDTIAWDVPDTSAVSLHFSDDASLTVSSDGITGGTPLALVPGGPVRGSLAARFRHLAGRPTFTIASADRSRIPDLLRTQLAVEARDAHDGFVDATGIQPAGVLDDRFAFHGDLGVIFDSGTPTVRVWAPTARSVALQLFDGPDPLASPIDVVPMTYDPVNGTWTVEGEPSWDRKHYLFEVEVYARSTGRIERNVVTDPYSVSLSMNSQRSQLLDLDDADLAPVGWDSLRKPSLAAPEDAVLYELHVRDFSIHDLSVPEPVRGTFRAFTFPQSDGMRHLNGLARAGLTHIHLLPAFDCATIPEDRALRQTTGDLSGFGPDALDQQAAVQAIRDQDGFNWCYDPYHYTTPEGSYATGTDGPTRVVEFREMVAGLQTAGLRTVMDVVYNHTNGSLQGDTSVLDKIVPDYYHRLDDAGFVATSSCCPNTATEHVMMEKLMIDSLLTWATAYKVDGFRFDLMGHHTKANLERARDALQSLTLHEDGVDGRAILLYGEGWNFGEVANDARFVQATQANMGDNTGIGTFNDRMRDGIRGGGPFDTGVDHVRRQGFINGLYTDPNAENTGSSSELDDLLRLTDWIRAGLAGSIEDYMFVDRTGRRVRAGDLDYGGQGVGYTSDPQEVVNYAAAHDNETLFDINQYKLPLGTDRHDRVRVQNLGNSIVALSQGIPFFHAGQDLLRSKSSDRNSFDSGDWFNLLDFSYQTNGWGRGLPPRPDNEASWAESGPRLANPDLAVQSADIVAASTHLDEMLRVRKSSVLFRLRQGADVREQVAFHNTGPQQVPGVIVMGLGDETELVVIINARPDDIDVPSPISGTTYTLHPVQRHSADPVVRTASFDAHSGQLFVPARTTAVFVSSDWWWNELWRQIWMGMYDLWTFLSGLVGWVFGY